MINCYLNIISLEQVSLDFIRHKKKANPIDIFISELQERSIASELQFDNSSKCRGNRTWKAQGAVL